MYFKNLKRSLCLASLMSNLAFASPEGATPPKVVPESQAQMQLSFAPVVAKVAPCVVNIFTTRRVQDRMTGTLMNDPFFRQFFGNNLPQGAMPSRVQSSLGSGVIVRGDGIVITNYHVIRNADQIKVVLMDGREFAATIAGKDPKTDLVALKLVNAGKSLPFLELRDAEQLQVGDIVLAFGNPFGLGHTVTSGIVSALARNQMGGQDYRSLIQTDAAINPGNSGGPLVSLDGKLIGINTSIFSTSGGSIGIGFAIPANLVGPVIQSVDTGGQVQRPWVGIDFQTLTPEISKSLGLTQQQGVIVRRVFAKSAAEKAGLQEGDVIFKVGSQPVANESNFRFRIATAKLGEIVRFQVQRGKSTQEIPVEMELAKDPGNNKRAELTGMHPLAGASVTALSPALADELNLPYNGDGVVIFAIKPGMPASLSGLTIGDVIQEINSTPIASVDDLIKAVSKGKSIWDIKFRRGGELSTIRIQSW